MKAIGATKLIIDFLRKIFKKKKDDHVSTFSTKCYSHLILPDCPQFSINEALSIFSFEIDDDTNLKPLIINIASLITDNYYTKSASVNLYYGGYFIGKYFNKNMIDVATLEIVSDSTELEFVYETLQYKLVLISEINNYGFWK
jgi:hypothetical protein